MNKAVKTRLIALTFGAAVMLTIGQAVEAQESPLPADQAPAELVTAIEIYMANELEVESSGMDCQAAIDEGAEGGSWCWSLLELTDDEAFVGFGQVRTDVGADPVTFIRQSDGSWAPGSASPGAPETGTGLAQSNRGLRSLWVGGLAALMLGGALAFTAALARNRRQAK